MPDDSCYVLIRDGNLWIYRPTLQIEKFIRRGTQFTAVFEDGEITTLTESEIDRVWKSLNVRQRAQLIRQDYVDKTPLLTFMSEPTDSEQPFGLEALWSPKEPPE